MKDERLVQKYGGDGCPGLFPQWDEDGILEELDECLNPLPPESEVDYQSTDRRVAVSSLVHQSSLSPCSVGGSLLFNEFSSKDSF